MEKRSMKHYAGLDVSVKETSVCIIDEAGKICREVKVPSHPEDLVDVLKDPAWRLERIGLEAGPLSQWLFSGLVEAGLPAVCIETRHTKAFLKAQVNKSDRNDARGIAQMMRVNLFRPVHVKTLTSQKRRALLTARKILQDKAVAIENDIRGLLRNFGLKVGVVGVVKFDERIRELVEGMPELIEIMEPLLTARQKLRAARNVHSAPPQIAFDRSQRRRVQALDDDPRGWTRRIFGVQRHHRCSRPLQELESRGPLARIDAGAQSIGRKPASWPGLAVRGLYDANVSLRSRASHDNPRAEMVMAKVLGDECRQATRAPEGYRRTGSPIGGHRASHLD